MAPINLVQLAGDLEVSMATTKNPNEDQKSVFFGATMPLFIIMLIVVGLRIYTRLKKRHKVFWDDYIMVFAFLLEIVAYTLNLAYFVKGGGKHLWVLEPEAVKEALRLSFFIILITMWCNTLIKVSCVVMILRLKNDRIWLVGLSILTFVMVSVTLSGTIELLVACRPISAFWTIAQFIAGRCWSIETLLSLSYFWGAMFAVTDLIVALIPILFIRKIKIPLREKIVLGCLMGAGLVAMALCITKTVLYAKFAYSADRFYHLTIVMMWMHLELMIGMIAGSIPTLKALSQSWLQKASKKYKNIARQIWKQKYDESGEGGGKNEMEESSAENTQNTFSSYEKSPPQSPMMGINEWLPKPTLYGPIELHLTSDTVAS